MKKTLFILLFLSICKISFSQVWWNEFKDVDTSNYFFISDINGQWDTIYIDDLNALLGAAGSEPDSIAMTVDTLFIYYPDTTYKAAVIHPANLDNDPANEIQVLSGSSGTTSNTVLNLSNGGGTYTITEGSGIDFTSETSAGFTITATDPSISNELQTLTESLDFIDITGSGTAAMTITSPRDGPVYRTYMHTERPTLRPWWADAETSWYLADERFISVTSTCGLPVDDLFDQLDNFGNYITDSCTINVVLTDQYNAVAYDDGFMYFVPYAGQLTLGADSVKIRTRNRDNVWSTPVPKQAVNVVDGESDYAWVYVNAPTYSHEFEITYYSPSMQISELEYFYIRGNNDIPMVKKNSNNTFYNDNTFLGKVGDQYLSFGTTGQLLSSDGTGIEWIDPYEFDSTGIYDYVDANIYDTTYLYDYITTNDLWNKSTDTVINEPDWNRLQLDEYGKGMYNNYGKAVATINYNGTFNSMPIESFDIDRTNEHRLEDNYIEDESFNYINFIKKNDGSYFFNPPFINSTNVQLLQNKTSLTTASDFYITDSLIYSCANQDLSVYDWDGVSLSSITLRHFYDNLLLYQDYSLQVTDEELIFLYYSAGSLRKANKSDIDNGTWTGVLESLGDVSSSTDLLDFGINNDKWFIQDSDNHIKVYQFNDWLDFVNSTLLFTINLPPTALGFNSTSSYYKDDYIIYSSYNSDSLYIFDASNGDLIHSTNFPDNMVHINEYNDIIYSGFLSNLASYVFIARDTSFTTLPEKLDTSNYYSYSIEIEGNNVDTVRTGIATWLDGNVSYNWCSGDTLYTGWHRFDLDFKAAEHDSIKPVFVIADTTSIKNVRLFLKQYQNDAFDDTAIQERIDSVITIFVTHDTNDADTVIGNEYNTTLTLAGTELQLTDGGGTLTQELSSFLDNTDTQGFDVATFTGGLLSLSIDNDGDATHEFDFDARYLQSEVDGSVTNEGVLSMNTDLANVTFSVNSNSSGSVPMYFTEETAVSGDNRAVDLERTGNAITFNLKDADELESVTIIPAADYFLVWDATDSDWKATTISNIPGDGTGTDDQTLSIVSAAAGTISIESGNTIDLTTLVQNQVVQESTTVGTGFDLSGYQIVADFNEFTTDASPEGDEFIIMYDVSGVTHEKIDIDDLATYIGSGELTTVGTGFSLAGYQINADFDAFTSDNTFSGTDEVVYLSFATHKKGTLAGMGAYMQANWGDGTGTDDQAIYYFLSGSTPALRLDGTSTGMEFDAGEGLVSQGFEEGTLDRILYTHDWTEFNTITTGLTTSDFLLVLDGTDEAKMTIDYLSTLIGGSDGNGLWDSGNTLTSMANGMSPLVNDYLMFKNAANTTAILYIDDATNDFVSIRTISPSTIDGTTVALNVNGGVNVSGEVAISVTSNTATRIMGMDNFNVVSELDVGRGMEIVSGDLDIQNDYISGIASYIDATGISTSGSVNVSWDGQNFMTHDGQGWTSANRALITLETGYFLVSLYGEVGGDGSISSTFTGTLGSYSEFPNIDFDTNDHVVSRSMLIDVETAGNLTIQFASDSGTSTADYLSLTITRIGSM